MTETAQQLRQLPDLVYFVESPTDGTVLIAMDVVIEDIIEKGRQDIVISWYDTAHERKMVAEKVRFTADGMQFSFVRAAREGGQEYFFTPLNLKIYNERIRKKLIHDQEFQNDEDLKQAFLATREA